MVENDVERRQVTGRQDIDHDYVRWSYTSLLLTYWLNWFTGDVSSTDSDTHSHTSRMTPVSHLYYKNKYWLQFLFIVKAAVLKQQISKFYPQIQRTEASDHIYFSQRPFINVKAIFCAENLRIKFWYLLF